MKKSRTCFALKDVLPDVIAKITARNSHDQINLESAWNEVIGTETVGLAYTGFKNGCVFVTVDTPARLYQFKLKRITVLRRLSALCPEVKNIYFKIGKVQ